MLKCVIPETKYDDASHFLFVTITGQECHGYIYIFLKKETFYK